MEKPLQAIEKALKKRNFDSPPLHLWQPEFSGDIDIRIDKLGQWYHEGAVIERASIVELFASILRREDDDHYYLVTPGEKWRVKVDLLPLIVIDITQELGVDGLSQLRATLNTGKSVAVTSENPIYLESRADNIAALRLPHGLAALFNRNAWYTLVDLALSDEEGAYVTSAGSKFRLESG